MIQSRLLPFVLGAALAGVAGPVLAQDNSLPTTNGAAAETANRIIDKKGIGLTPAQAYLISRGTINQTPQPVAAELTLAIGAPVPDSMMLIELPVEVKDQIGSLRDFKFARLQNNTIVLVDPTSRVVVDIIQK